MSSVALSAWPASVHAESSRPEEVWKETDEEVSTKRAPYEVRASTGPSFVDGGHGWGYGAGVARRWEPVSAGLWVDHDRFSVEYLDDDVTMTFIGASGRFYPIQDGIWDPHLRLDLGGVISDPCSGFGGQIGAGLDIYLLDFLKLGPSVSYFAYGSSCAIPATTVDSVTDTRRWLSVRLDVTFAPN